MTDQLREIGERLKGLRNIMGISAEKMAELMKLCLDEYYEYERGQKDFSFSFLFNASNILGVDVVDIISGETPKLTTCALVRKGEGYEIKRESVYDYRHLAYTFSKKKGEPFLVTVEPNSAEEIELHSHDGQEFDYMLSGTMEFHIGNMMYELSEGDSVYYDSGMPHAMKAVGKKELKFIAVVMK